MSVEIVVKEIQQAISHKTGKPYVTIVDTTGERIYVHDSQLIKQANLLKRGQHISITYELNGKFKNGVQIIPSDVVDAVAPTVSSAAPSPFNDKKDKRITRLACINSSIEFHKIVAQVSNESPTERSVLDLAEKFEKWTYREDDAK